MSELLTAKPSGTPAVGGQMSADWEEKICACPLQ
jgi:hypothetical protein